MNKIWQNLRSLCRIFTQTSDGPSISPEDQGRDGQNKTTKQDHSKSFCISPARLEPSQRTNPKLQMYPPRPKPQRQRKAMPFERDR